MVKIEGMEFGLALSWAMASHEALHGYMVQGIALEVSMAMVQKLRAILGFPSVVKSNLGGENQGFMIVYFKFEQKSSSHGIRHSG